MYTVRGPNMMRSPYESRWPCKGLFSDKEIKVEGDDAPGASTASDEHVDKQEDVVACSCVGYLATSCAEANRVLRVRPVSGTSFPSTHEGPLGGVLLLALMLLLGSACRTVIEVEEEEEEEGSSGGDDGSAEEGNNDVEDASPGEASGNRGREGMPCAVGPKEDDNEGEGEGEDDDDDDDDDEEEEEDAERCDMSESCFVPAADATLPLPGLLPLPLPLLPLPERCGNIGEGTDASLSDFPLTVMGVDTSQGMR